MPLKYWDEAFLTVTYLINRLPTKVLEFSSPLERLFSKKTNYSGLRTFGCAYWPNLRPFNTHKLQFRSKQCVFLGYNTMHKGFKCLDVADGRVYISRDVVFDETVFLFSKLNPNAGARLHSKILLLPYHLFVIPPGCELLNDPCTNVQTNVQSSAVENLVSIDQVGGGGDLAITSSVPSADSHSDSGLRCTPVATDPEASLCPAPKPEEDSGTRDNSKMVTGGEADPDNARGSPRLVPGIEVDPVLGVEVDPGQLVRASPSRSPTQMPRAPVEPRHMSHDAALGGFSVHNPSAASDFQLENYANVSSVSDSAAEPSRHETRLKHGIRKTKVYTDGTVQYSLAITKEEPTDYRMAMDDSRWKSAMDSEYTTLLKNKAWRLVPRKPDVNVIDCKWVYKVKKKADGSVDRYKARLVAKGFKQRYGIDY
jgi:hypothetical protein